MTNLLESLRDADLTTLLATLFLLMGVYLVLVVAAGASPLARNLLFKGRLFARSVAHLLLSGEKSGWPKNRPDPDAIRDVQFTAVKRVVFVRHGESTWNEVFNKGFGPSFPIRLVKGLVSEAALLVTTSSFFVDSPLNAEGYRQAKALRKFLAVHRPAPGDPSTADAAALMGTAGTSIIVSSNLRRAVATTAIAFWDRLERTGEKVYVLSSLQEMARNVDAYALAGTREAVPLHGIEHHIEGLAPGLRKGESGSVVGLNTHFNAGNKPIGRSGLSSMNDFASWTLAQDAETIIAGGHSLWFKEFFKNYLPRASTHKSKKKKMVNCGVVAFTLQHARHPTHGDLYRIDPDSITVVYGGFH
mmetsp:Transcript_17265/g.42503  ORF Transcript_17265/g.42503 Transcript_17265/m.42503 type:complete len:359 (-) Transcript_17265:386-1462(-)|eukprot:CAMPEP_0197615348 /NCGR_PEP_ID=MMETSP1326-20131121/59985_1 /TAXON_ID=1155430 /ORGANISM="Genus nov. species nov., Strain RCC2288" /LENGTH=358 /DNA_ID=CAMNT_0043184229 /DNA_START=1154 /DNA_END=2230 /DNA_ORIENTATION=+